MSPDRRPIPGYTGHCPGLKFDVGHSYAWAVQHSPQQLPRTHVGHVVVSPRATDAGLVQSAPVDVVDRGREVTLVSNAPYRPSPPKGGIAGYTGFVPGGRFVVGTNYRKVADDCFSDLERRTAERHEREERERRSRSLGRLSAGRRVRETGAAPAAALTNGAVSSALDAKYSRYSAGRQDEEPVPIPGYGGFVPKARSSQMGVGKRFSRFADEGFHALHDQVQRYRQSHQRPVSVSRRDRNGTTRS
ncbi:protein FAM166B-like [Pollicipes pollicipes]|uniref:protein FAM166B-like n=1 Tax=Pollicipes pollicipes TaxID=41117 RepID=UPI001884F5E1|nr:protein FAM166B-like [Pollicipes pollicipes]